jgi:hypothetical protein|tara:strand:+ start:322 stop:855 length:534 start_codon:yes stop_codon:yes gene_type:complete
MEHVKKKRNSYNAGENNSRWSGGKGSYYKDHYQLKLNRAEKIKQIGNKCEDCGADGNIVILIARHKNGNINDHKISNLEIKCSLCCGTKKTSKIKRKYGMTINEMRSKYNLSFYTVYNRILPGCDTKKELIKRLKKESTLAQKRIDKNNKTVKDDLELIEELEEDVVEDNIIKSETT